MAGSLNHITNEDGTFRAGLVETDREKVMALIECHQIIAHLLHTYGLTEGERERILEKACALLGYPLSHVPVIQPELHGGESWYKARAAKDEKGQEDD